jgi:hypothetical protein
MLNTLESLSLLTLLEIVGPVVLLIALAYGVIRAGRRPGGAVERVSDEVTRAHFRQE